MSSYITTEELSRFREQYELLLLSDVRLIDTIVRYLCRKKGKFLRPSLIINVAHSLNGLNSKIYVGASLIEMIHLATLVHDDIVDESDLRRGWPTISRVWKNKISLLIGDYIFSKSLSTVIKLDDIELIKIISKAADSLSKGELMQFQGSKKRDMSEEMYYRMIKDKTASLFSAACELSAKISSQNSKDVQKFKKFGESFGMAYQIKDDIDDVVGSYEELGKPTSLDLKRNMLTLPYIYCLGKLSSLEKAVFLIKIKKLS
ncbi:MAG: polyprenyl synthetase, partial [Candidatus Marinimicrobia bacterium]|nr:polyprenyl synthetase [Candidatus Neomarinimicrobiota bacterium]